MKKGINECPFASTHTSRMGFYKRPFPPLGIHSDSCICRGARTYVHWECYFSELTLAVTQTSVLLEFNGEKGLEIGHF